MEYRKTCTICFKSFKTVYKNQNLCGFECSQKRQRENSKLIMRKKSGKLCFLPCVVCGEKKIEIHHQDGKIFNLCREHHVLVQHKYADLYDLFQNH